MRKFDFSYDRENDDLFLYNKKSKSKGSIEFGNLVLDFNTKKELVGIEIMDASKFISDIIGNGGISKQMLEDLQECKIEIKSCKNQLMIKLFLMVKKKEIPAVFPVPNITESPALAYT